MITPAGQCRARGNSHRGRAERALGWSRAWRSQHYDYSVLGFCSGCKNDTFALKSLPCVRWGRICWKEKRLVFPTGGSDKLAWLKRASCGPAACPSAGLLAKTCPEATWTSCWREQVPSEDKLHMVLGKQPDRGQPGSVHPADAPLDHLHFKSPSGNLIAYKPLLWLNKSCEELNNPLVT